MRPACSLQRDATVPPEPLGEENDDENAFDGEAASGIVKVDQPTTDGRCLYGSNGRREFSHR
ncbi:hypothetical protein BGX38DRAFT_1214882 [Terfezia claveryi]|nr:hypothetical protein BGX38DRAFT_1214882 [Terfezia claveryi]